MSGWNQHVSKRALQQAPLVALIETDQWRTYASSERGPISDDDICSGAGDNCLQLCLLRLGYSKLVQSLLEIV
jgi:hypothetical protein